MTVLLNNAVEVLLLIFLSITFVQSGMDKVLDWKGNLSWLKGHFSKSFLRNVVSQLLFLLVLMELASGVLCLLGIYEIVFLENNGLAFIGAIGSCITLLMLLFGQRVAKDYDGARTIVIYFIPAVFLLFLLHN